MTNLTFLFSHLLTSINLYLSFSVTRAYFTFTYKFNLEIKLMRYSALYKKCKNSIFITSYNPSQAYYLLNKCCRLCSFVNQINARIMIISEIWTTEFISKFVFGNKVRKNGQAWFYEAYMLLCLKTVSEIYARNRKHKQKESLGECISLLNLKIR